MRSFVALLSFYFNIQLDLCLIYTLYIQLDLCLV